MKKLLLLAFLATTAARVGATIFDFDLKGTAGSGLLPGNEPGAVIGGTGGEVGAGITYNDATLTLTINVGWGSSQGFTDLSSTASASHIHGPTTTNNGSGFTQTAGVLFTLVRSSSLVTGGTISTNITLTAGQPTDLFNGKYYINIHTVNNGGGELRGFLVPIYTLTLTTNGNGGIAASPSASSYTSGTVVTLTATPNANYAFTGWSGSAAGVNNPLSVTMTNNKAITASFVFATNSAAASIDLAAQISWLAQTNVNYQVQAASVLNSNVWFDLGSVVAGNNATNYYYDPVGNIQSRFYRVMTRP